MNMIQKVMFDETFGPDDLIREVTTIILVKMKWKVILIKINVNWIQSSTAQLPFLQIMSFFLFVLVCKNLKPITVFFKINAFSI